MIDGTDLLSIETDVRDLIGEETAKLWPQTRVFRAINSEVMRLARKVIALDNGYLEQTYTLTPTATVTLPTNCYIVRNIEMYLNGAWMQPTIINDHSRGQYQEASSGTTYPAAVQFYDGSIVFEPGIGSASSLRIKYARLPAEMRYEAMTTGGTTTFVMGSSASVIDDVYIGDKIITLSGTSSGDIRTVSDYVGSSRTITVSAAFTGTVDTTTYYSTLLPEPLAKYPDVVALGAAVRLLARRRDDNLTQMLAVQYERDLSDMLEALAQRQTEQSMRGNYLPDWSE